jgi:NTE family protein
MLRALAERPIEPDVIHGTSVGAINGAVFATEPTADGVRRLSELCREGNVAELSTAALMRRVTTLARTGTYLESLDQLRKRLADLLPVERVEELEVAFQCVAASIERAAEHWVRPWRSSRSHLWPPISPRSSAASSCSGSRSDQDPSGSRLG